jgi:hypothetical protein
MKAYKFFRPERVAPFSDHVWPEDGWVEAAGPLEACRNGVHACHAQHLPYWLMDELWEVELEEEVTESDLKVVARRGRLVQRIDAWDENARAAFAEQCVRHTAAYAIAELRERGAAGAADRLEQAATVADLVERAADARDEAVRVQAGDAATLVDYLTDAAGYSAEGLTAGTAFVAAHAALTHAPPGVADPFGAERDAQARWLVERLGVSADGA